MPILPKHVWGKYNYKTIAEQKFDPPLVGTGPYTLVEWKTGQFARFVRNPNYWGNKGFADEVVLRFFPDHDRHHGPGAEVGRARLRPRRQPGPVQAAPGRPGLHGRRRRRQRLDQLAFNTYGTGTGKTIKGGGPSTKALLDPAFRDALGYAVDNQALVDRVLGGFGDVGHHQRPADPLRLARRARRSAHLRHRARQAEARRRRLSRSTRTASASTRRASRSPSALIYPNTNDTYAKSAQFVKEWYGQLGHRRHAPEPRQRHADQPRAAAGGRPAGKAEYDIELWGWSGNPDPNGLLSDLPVRPDRRLSDSQYCNPDYDALYDKQLTPRRATQRQATLAQMQNLIYDEAPYDILYYDSNLDVYRNDRFAGWQNMPGERDAVLHLRHARLHAAHGRQAAAVADAGRVAGRRRRRSARRGAPAAPRGRAGTGSTHRQQRLEHGLVLGASRWSS